MVRIYVQSCVQPKIGCPRTLRATRRSRHRRRRRRRGERIIRLRGRKPVVHSVSIRGGGLRPAFCGMIRRRRSACSEHHRRCRARPAAEPPVAAPRRGQDSSSQHSSSQHRDPHSRGNDGFLGHAVFLDLCEDQPAWEVRREAPGAQRSLESSALRITCFGLLSASHKPPRTKSSNHRRHSEVGP